jgi:hypothetical protein
MDPDAILSQARSSIAALARRTADLLRSRPDVQARVPGAAWSVREAAVHLVNFAALHAEIATGAPSPRLSLRRVDVALDNDRRIADVPETDPEKLAGLVTDAFERFLEATADRPGGQEVIWHCGLPVTLAGLAGIQLGELMLHAYDVATAVGAPWPIDPEHAQLALYGFGPCYGLVVNEERVGGWSAGYGIEVRDGPAFTVRFVDGEYRLEPADSGRVDCTISADPVAFLMVGSGRLSMPAAVALGLISIAGDRPELGFEFPDLFIFP